MVVIKSLHQLFQGKDLTVVLRTPAEQRHKVDYRLCQESLLDQIFVGRMAASLGQFLVFPDIYDLVDFFQEVPEYETSMYVHKKMKTNEETSLTLLQEVLPLLEAQEDYSNDALFEMLSAFGKEKGYKTGYIMWPIRTALSGKQMTPAGATEILEILGKEESLKRLNAAVEKLQAALA